ncbi:MAG: hypothetical protein F6J97_15290 [Leptolyngbya sp. SIO4C1]|nr:hypothetical protein [Leptolyngbya sp. SIO4C1]
MTQFARTNFFSDVNTLEGHLAHAIRAYAHTVGDNRYSERSETDGQPWCKYAIDKVFSGDGTTKRLLIARLAIPLEELGDTSGTVIWQQAREYPSPIVLPASLKASS